MTALRVRGTLRRRGGVPLLVLSHRLDGHDTFQPAELELDPDGAAVRVRVHTFDDVTVLRPSRPDAFAGWGHGVAWSGLLRLPRTRRAAAVPTDLADALASAGLPGALETLDPADRRHLLGYLRDAADPAIRRIRIHTIVGGLRDLSA